MALRHTGTRPPISKKWLADRAPSHRPPSPPPPSPTMPTGVVIDAFKSIRSLFSPASKPVTKQPATDLIRHGRQHNDSKAPQAPFQASPSPATAQPARDADRDRSRQEKKQAVAPVEERAQPMRAQSYRPEAEAIVQEENENKAKLPVYRGMEQFKLIEKMGECVQYPLPIAADPNHRSYCGSGAFSNVYKALDVATSQKVASMYCAHANAFQSNMAKQSRRCESLNLMHRRLGLFHFVDPFFLIRLLFPFFRKETSTLTQISKRSRKLLRCCRVSSFQPSSSISRLC